MRSIPIKEGYIKDDIIIYPAGKVKVLNNIFLLVFIANKDKVIYDVTLYNEGDVKIGTNTICIYDDIFVKI